MEHSIPILIEKSSCPILAILFYSNKELIYIQLSMTEINNASPKETPQGSNHFLIPPEDVPWELNIDKTWILVSL